ncbi:unnamed protein product [Peniophora sp. CBMAI 1063]|nr:unnamed protein product [Peniophora sp. CBMAI 1063]
MPWRAHTRLMAGRTTTPPLVYRNLVSVPMALHLGVLAIYIALCIVWLTDVEQNIHVSLASAARTQTWINLASHVIMLAFATAIIALMQPIATRSPFGNLPQTLTTLADKVSAWSGLGSSILSLFHNLRYPATLSNALLTTTYFATLSGLGISSSFLFDVPAVNSTISSNMTTRIGTPSVRALVPPSINGVPKDFSAISFDWYRSGVGVGMLFGSNATIYPGLSANRIYDTLSPPMGASSNSSVVVDYTDFNVKCGAVPGVSISAMTPQDIQKQVISAAGKAAGGYDLRLPALLQMNYTLGEESMVLYDSLSISEMNTSFAVSRLWQPADVLVRVPNSPLVPGIGRNLVLYNIYNETGLVAGSQPILDAKNSTGSPWPLNVQRPQGMPPFVTGMMVQAIGCSLFTSTGQATIDGTTNELLDQPTPSEQADVNSTWDGWQPDLTKSNKLEDMWASMFLPNGSISLWDDQPQPTNGQWSCINYLPTNSSSNSTWNIDQLQQMYQGCHIPMLIEEYLTTRLFGPSTIRYNGLAAFLGDVTRSPLGQNATLATLESALANATAMTMWSAARQSTLSTYTDVSPSERNQSSKRAFVFDENSQMPFSTRLAPATGHAVVNEQVLVGRVSLNVPSLIVGTILAALLTGIGMYVLALGDARVGGAPIEDAGLLSLMALDNSAIASRLTGASMYNSNTRRRAGAFLVKIVDGRLVPVEGAGEYELDGKGSSL